MGIPLVRNLIKDSLMNQGVHHDVVALRDVYLDEFPVEWRSFITNLANRAENNIELAGRALKELS